jgi:hypothetical protein
MIYKCEKCGHVRGRKTCHTCNLFTLKGLMS